VWYVPPETSAEVWTTPSTVDRHALWKVLDVEVGAEVVWHRIEARRVDDPGSAGGGDVAVLHEHGVDELLLAGEVEIIGARFCTGLHECLAVLQVGADSRDQYPG